MLRRAAIATSVCVATAGMLTGCGDLPASENPSDQVSAPVLGACRVLGVDDLRAPTNHSRVVDCAEPHTAQTFVVGELPPSSGTRYDDNGHGRFVYDRCQEAFGEFLDVDESTVMRSRLSWSWFRPSEKGWQRGARWYRCDVVGGPTEATELRNLPTDAREIFAKDYPDAWMTCARGETAEEGSKVSCDVAHDWRAVTTIKVGEPEDAYPGDRIVEVLSRDFCRDSVRGWLGFPPDFDFGYTWFRQDRWEGGNRRSICWARTER